MTAAAKKQAPTIPVPQRKVILELFLKDVARHPDLQSRDGMSDETVEDYAASYRALVSMPPVVVFKEAVDGKVRYWLADGWHRCDAAAKAGLKSIPADVRTGTFRDAVFFAAQANKRHGLRPDRADLIRSAYILLKDPEWWKWTNKQIAEHCGIKTQNVVAEARARILTENKDRDDGRRKVVRNGKAYTLNVSNLARPEEDDGLPDGPDDDAEQRAKALKQAGRSLTKVAKQSVLAGVGRESVRDLRDRWRALLNEEEAEHPPEANDG